LLAAGGVEYFASSLSQGPVTNTVALWAMRNTSSLAIGNPSMVLSRIVVPTLPYTDPDPASQKPGPLPYGSTLFPPDGFLAYLSGGDSRVQSLTYAGARLYLTLPTGLTDENGRWVSGAAYIVLSPAFRNNMLTARVLNQGYLAVNNNHLLCPAMAVNAYGRGAIAVTLVGPDHYPSAAFIPFDTFATPGTLEIGATGTLPQDGFTGYEGQAARWGDYSGAVAAGDGSIWMVVEYIGTYPRTEYANWNTYILRKQ
jgi:hypothetical protein